jgi:hypothetical protein
MNRLQRIPRRSERGRPPTLRFTPYAWSKVVFLRDREELEVMAFAISSSVDLLLVEDACLVRQNASSQGVRLEEASVADFFDVCVDRGLAPERFGRVWIHAHPGPAGPPSAIDRQTFARAFGECDWAVRVIVPRTGPPAACIRFRSGPGGTYRLEVAVDFGCAFPGSAPRGWEAEYRRYV